MKMTQTTITIKDIISKVANTATTIISILLSLLLLSLLQLLAEFAPSDDAVNIVPQYLMLRQFQYLHDISN